MENALESVRFESIKARFERTRERDDDASSIEPFKEREKKNRMNWFKSNTHNFGRPSVVSSLFRDRRRPERRDGDRDQRGRVVVFVAVGSRAQISRRRWLRRSSSRGCWDAHDFR